MNSILQRSLGLHGYVRGKEGIPVCFWECTVSPKKTYTSAISQSLLIASKCYINDDFNIRFFYSSEPAKPGLTCQLGNDLYYQWKVYNQVQRIKVQRWWVSKIFLLHYNGFKIRLLFLNAGQKKKTTNFRKDHSTCGGVYFFLNSQYRKWHFCPGKIV